MRPELRILDDAAAIATEAAMEFAVAARASVTAHGFFSVALAGGSTPRRLYETIAKVDAARGNVPWETIHIFFGDERPVGPDHAESNFHMASDALLSRVPIPERNIHRMLGEMDDPERAAELYELDLRSFFVTRTALTASSMLPASVRPAIEGVWPRFDLILLGMGADGHTASLFPETTAVWEQRRWVAANWVPKLEQHRLTLTPPVLNSADRVLFLVSGDDKAEALAEVLESERDPGRLPAQIVHPWQGQVTWLVDLPAAAKLAS